MEGIIELRQVGRQYTKDKNYFWGLRDLNLVIQPGEVISIIGPSGCGKTTTLKILAGLLDISEGSVKYAQGAVEEVRSKGLLGYVPQFPSLLPNRDVLGNIYFPLEVRNMHNSVLVNKLLEFTDLNLFKHYYPHQLSGGMKQKVAIVRALVYGPEILLMDEPFSSLDEMMREKLDVELMRIRDEFKKTIVFVTHSVEEAVFISDRIAIFSNAPGKVVDIVQNDLNQPRTLELKRSQSYFDQVNNVRAKLESI